MAGFIVIPDEFHKLDLTPNEKLILALVFSYSQEDQGCYYGSLSETSERLNISRRNVIECLKRLADKGYLEKKGLIIDGIAKPGYACGKICTPVQKMHPSAENAPEKVVKNLHPGAETAPNNIINNITTLSTTRTREEFDFYGFFKELGADDQSLRDWKEVRRKKGGINTKSAADAILKEINKSGKSVRECIAKSASSSWCGFKWAWWQRELDEESGNNVRRNENQRVNDRRRGTPPSHPKTAAEWGFGDRQKKK